jgi:hypothetical protein
MKTVWPYLHIVIKILPHILRKITGILSPILTQQASFFVVYMEAQRSSLRTERISSISETPTDGSTEFPACFRVNFFRPTPQFISPPPLTPKIHNLNH